MAEFLQILINAVSVGSLYALIALGYTMVYGILKFINFAHSDVVVLGAWISYTLATWLLPQMGVSPSAAPWWGGLLVLVLAMIACALIGFVIERLAYKPLRSAPRLNVLITAIGVSLFLQNFGQLQFPLVAANPSANPPVPELRLPFGTQPQGMPSLVPSKNLLADTAGGSVRLELLDLVIVATAVALMLALEVLVHHTKFGMAMRAVSFNMDSAALMGVPVNRVVSLTFMLGAALAAAAGFLIVMKYSTVQQTAHAQWVLLGLKAFVAAVVGGIGNLRGAVLGGFLIAFIELYGEFLGARYFVAGMKDIYVFALLILVLLVKPSGLLGSPVREKV